MLITKSEAAREIRKSRQWIDQLFHDRPRPLFFVKEKKNKKGEWIWKVDTDHVMWKSFAEKYQAEAEEKEKQKESEKNIIKLYDIKIDKATKQKAQQRARERVYKPLSEEDEKHLEDLNVKSQLAKIEKEIYKNELTKEKVEQERIRTLELKREVAPIELVKHWFSFAENLMQRIYRRPHEISPEVKALYMANEDKKAEQKIIREMEGIVNDCWKEMIADMEKEKFKIEKELKIRKNIK